MIKKITLIFLLLVAVAFGIYAGFSTRTVNKTIRVPYPPFRVAEQISTPFNLSKWMLPFSADGANPDIQNQAGHKAVRLANDSAILTIKSVFNTEIDLYTNGDHHGFSYQVSPDTANVGSDITMSYKTTLLQKWMGGGDAIKSAENSFENLKEYLQDSKRFYGYEIRTVSVVDTSFLFIRETVPLSEKRTATKKLFEQLIKYAEEHNAGYNGIRIFYPLVTDDKITLFASIGVSNQVTPPANSPIQYKMMPFEKKLLEADYQGAYGKADKVFEALEQYKADFNLTSMAIPFQKFLSDGYDFADDQIVQLKVYYPVF